MNDLLDTLTNLNIGVFFKFAVALLLFLYVIFALILFNHIRSLKKIIIIKESLGSTIVQSFGLIYLLLSTILFLLSLAIL